MNLHKIITTILEKHKNDNLASEAARDIIANEIVEEIEMVTIGRVLDTLKNNEEYFN